MKHSVIFFGFLFSIALFGCDTSDEITGSNATPTAGSSSEHFSKKPAAPANDVEVVSVTEGSVTLWSNKTENAGSVLLMSDENNLYIQYTVTGTSTLRETHLDVSDVQFTERGAPGRYAYTSSHPSGTQSTTYVIPITWNAGSTIYFRAHAEIASGKKSSSAFAGTIITPQRGAWYGLFSTTLAPPPPPPPTVFSISGSAFVDNNGDGVRSVGEPGIAGVSISLSTGETTTTDAAGDYSFAGLDPGTYSVLASSIDGMIETSTLTKKVSISTTNTTADFGYSPEP